MHLKQEVAVSLRPGEKVTHPHLHSQDLYLFHGGHKVTVGTSVVYVYNVDHAQDLTREINHFSNQVIFDFVALTGLMYIFYCIVLSSPTPSKGRLGSLSYLE